MTRRDVIRRTAAVAAALATVAACTNEPDPEPQPEPPATYQQPPEDLCERVRFDEVRQRWDLTVPELHEPTSTYETERDWWYARCHFVGVAVDDRFSTKLDREFRPRGAVEVRVFREVAEAIDVYEQDAHTTYRRAENAESTDPTTDVEITASTAEISGWWDTGVSLEVTEELDPDDFVVGDFQITSLSEQQLMRHENLVAQVYLRALSPTGEAGEAAALLQELAAALIDEMVEHLTRTDGRPAPSTVPAG